MGGFTLGQPYGYGVTEQTTIVPGDAGAANPPAAGASYTLRLLGYDRFRLVAFRCALTTSVNAANRLVTIQYLAGDGTPVAEDGTPTPVTAGLTAVPLRAALRYGAAYGTTTSGLWFPLSGLWLEAGSSLKVNVANIDATDQLLALRLTFDRYLAESQTPPDPDED